MRDMMDYQEKYRIEPGEKYQVMYRRKHIIELMKKYEHKHILEVGCGLEPLFLYFDDYESMTIVEPCHDFAENAKQHIVEQEKSVSCIEDFFENTVEQLKSSGVEYDYIVVSSLLHELEQPEKLLQALSEVALENTVIHINVPNAYSLHKMIAYHMGLIADVHELSAQQKEMQRNWCYDLAGLVKIVEGFGFSVLEKGSFIPKFLTGSQMDRMLESGIITEDYYKGLDKLIEVFPNNGSEIYVQIKKGL